MSHDCFLPIATFPDATPRQAISLGMAIAARIDARFCASVHEVDIAPVSNVLADMAINVTAMSERAEADSKTTAGVMAQWLKQQADELAKPISIQRIRCRPEDLIDNWIVPSRTNDLTILAAPGSDQQEAMVIDLVFANGGPALIVPDIEVPATDEVFGVCIAWDAGRAAARAVRDAMPFLKAAKDVSIVVVDDDKAIEGKSAMALSHWLGHHGIASRLLTRSRGTVPVGETLQAAALAAGADMLVMGAYGHSRVRELVLGGATRSILEHTRLPILTTH